MPIRTRSLAPSTVAWVLSLATVALHLAIATRYGYHRDELYFIACSRHLAFGYVDHPPLIAFIAALVGAIFDFGLFGVRFFPAVAGGATALLTACIARDLGGGRAAQTIAVLAIIFSPVYARISGLLCIPVFEILLWTLGSWLVIRIANGGSRRLWLAVGFVLGIGLLTKHSMLVWVASLGFGVMLTSFRSELRSIFPWAAGAIALVMFAPNLIWLATHDWATVEFLHTMSRSVLVKLPRSLFLAGQLVYVHPIGVALAVIGVWASFSREHTRFRFLGFAFGTALAVLLVTRAKPYYLAPAYPPLIALGAVCAVGRAKLVIALLVATGIPFLLIALPILPLPRIDQALDAALGRIVRPENLTGELHDQYGWREQVEVVAGVVRSLSPDEKKRALVLTGNYGEAAAIEFFGAKDGLVAASGHMSYYLWRFDPARDGPVIAFGLPREKLDAMFEDVQSVALVDHPLAWSNERNLPVYVCRAPRLPLAEAWPSLKRYGHVAVRVH